MLKNTDIRIGNIIANGIEYKDTSVIGKVLSIGNDEDENEQILCECSESFEWFFKDNYCGVPLTGEWHEKFGAEKNGFLEYIYDISRFKNSDLFLVFSGDYLYIREYGEINRIKVPTDLICLWNKDLKKEFYVHEFQNLYQLITGKELILKNKII